MQLGFLDIDTRLERLSRQGDPLERLNASIDWELFRPILERIDVKRRKSTAGRKPHDRVLMFKLLILQRIHNVADERLEYLVADRLSFMRFLGLALGDAIPDARTVWAFREALKSHKLIDPLFETFTRALQRLGVELKSGQIIDATFVPVPVQRNSREDNAAIKAGAAPSWRADAPSNPQAKRAAHKDEDARWAKKGGVSHYGYKDHINVDARTKLITKWRATSASVHDSQILKDVLQGPKAGGKAVFADSAYQSQASAELLKAQGLDNLIHERSYQGKPLSDVQQACNQEKSRVRARVEHVFGTMQTSLGGMLLRAIGAARAQLNIGLLNLTYNLRRVETLMRLGQLPLVRVSA